MSSKYSVLAGVLSVGSVPGLLNEESEGSADRVWED